MGEVEGQSPVVKKKRKRKKEKVEDSGPDTSQASLDNESVNMPTAPVVVPAATGSSVDLTGGTGEPPVRIQ